MANFSYIRDNYKKTVVSLRRAVEECENKPTPLMIDGLLQRFHFASDLALKSCSEYMDTAGHRIDGTPSVVLKKAHDIKLIEDFDVWTAIIADRDASSQIYDNFVAERIANNVKNKYLNAFQTLVDRFS